MAKRISYTIHIPKPCQEGWQNMTPTEKGKFCQSCQKEVIDFSTLNDAEVVRILQARQGSVCGHVRKNQLGREMYITEYRWRFPFRADVLAGLLALAVLQPVLGHSAPQSPATFSGAMPPSSPNTSDLPHTLSDSTYRISGRVFDSKTGEPLPFVNIRLADTQTGATTDADGMFLLTLPFEGPQAVTLLFNFVGYETLTLSLTEAKVRSGESLQVHLKEQEMLLDGFMIITEDKDRTGKRSRK